MAARMTPQPFRIAAAACLPLMLLAAGCHPSGQQGVSSAPAPQAAIPLTQANAGPIAPAPALQDLPPARPAPIGAHPNGGDQYVFAEQAYAAQSAFGDSPPDYTFDYGQGERPWVWRGDDQSMQLAEPLPGGGDRYYYYEPGAASPYLVRDGGYAYGYDNGALVVVYDARGRPLPPAEVAARAADAGRLLARARALHDASEHQRRAAVAQQTWANRQQALQADRTQWADAETNNPDWRAFHATRQDDEQRQWAGEHVRREAQAARADQQIGDQQRAERAWAQARAANETVAQLSQPGGPAPNPRDMFHPGPPQSSASSGRPPSGQAVVGAPASSAAASSSSGAPLRGHRGPSSQPPSSQAANQAQLQAQQAAALQAQRQAQERAKLLAQQQQAAASSSGAAVRGHRGPPSQPPSSQAANQAQLQAQRAAALQAQRQAQARAKLLAQQQQAAASSQATPSSQAHARSHGHGPKEHPQSGQPASGQPPH